MLSQKQALEPGNLAQGHTGHLEAAGGGSLEGQMPELILKDVYELAPWTGCCG